MIQRSCLITEWYEYYLTFRLIPFWHSRKRYVPLFQSAFGQHSVWLISVPIGRFPGVIQS